MTNTEEEVQNLPLPAGPSDPEPAEYSERGKYAIAISLGVPIGVVLGLVIFDSAALGAALSVIFTPAIYFMLAKWRS